jgi:hypothetical protein
MPVSQQRRDELSRLAEKAKKPGPLVVVSPEATGSNDWAGKAIVAGLHLTTVDRMTVFWKSDADFIAAAFNAIPALLADLTAVEQRYRELFCAVWECPPEEFDASKHDEAVAEAHRQCRENFRLREQLAGRVEAMP